MGHRRKIQVVADARYQDHQGPDGHPERPERLLAVEEALSEFEAAIERRTPRPAEAHEIQRVHGREYWERVEQSAHLPASRLDPDTYTCRESFEVARLAAGGTLDLACSIAAGEATCGIAAVRPPGHHAEADRAMGFCLFNNVAVAARALQAEHGLDKLLILDWDVHHGNGTQHSFEDDPSVLYASTHQFPYYPGTGDFGEAGIGRGLGTTLNIPMPAGCGDAEYVGALARLLVPVARQYQPQMILVSCGFDAHREDPLASMDLTEAGYRAMTQIVRSLADEICGGRILFVLEGGYAASSLRDGSRAVLDIMSRDEGENISSFSVLEPSRPLRTILQRAASVHGGRCPEISAR
ncbi:MAG: histone deacetylase [Myxococcota bacterium]|nr:histone deacetylase [Myxococcota bacterium]